MECDYVRGVKGALVCADNVESKQTGKGLKNLKARYKGYVGHAIGMQKPSLPINQQKTIHS